MKESNQFQSKDKRFQILRAAVKLFAEEEFRNTTITEIAKEAGVGEGLVYYYFPNKEDILLSIFLSFWQDFNYQVEKVLFLKEGPKPSKKLRMVIKLLRSSLAKDKFSLYLLKVLTESLPYYYLLDKAHSDIAKQLIEKRNQVRLENRKFLTRLDQIIEGGLKNKDDNPKAVRQALYGACEMLLYGLFLKGSGREKNIGYKIKEAEKVIDKIISCFLT